MSALRFTRGLSRDEWLRLSGFGVAVATLHLVGWALFLYYSGQYRPLVGLGLTAYLFGLRHAFDADHIAAIDNTTRKLLQQGRRPMGVGFFFSLGHSTIVFSLVAGLALAARTVALADPGVPALRRVRRRRRLGHVPVDHRHPQPDRPGRHPPDLPRDARRRLRPPAARESPARAGHDEPLLRPLLPPDRRELADVPARRAVRARVRHRDRGRPARPRRGRRHPFGAVRSRSSRCRSSSRRA